MQHASEIPLGVGQHSPARPEHLECDEHDCGSPTELEVYMGTCVVLGASTDSISIPIAAENDEAVYADSVDMTASCTDCTAVLMVESTMTLPAAIDISMSDSLTPFSTEARPCAYPVWLKFSSDPATVARKLTAST